MEFRKMVMITLHAKQKKRHRCTEQTFGLHGRRRGWDSERTASKHVYFQVWNRSPVQVGCMRQVLGAGALGWPRGMGWGGRREGGSGWGIHVNACLIHVSVWQKPLQYCKVISLQLIKISGKKNVTGKSCRWGHLLIICEFQMVTASILFCFTATDRSKLISPGSCSMDFCFIYVWATSQFNLNSLL